MTNTEGRHQESGGGGGRGGGREERGSGRWLFTNRLRRRSWRRRCPAPRSSPSKGGGPGSGPGTAGATARTRTRTPCRRSRGGGCWRSCFFPARGWLVKDSERKRPEVAGNNTHPDIVYVRFRVLWEEKDIFLKALWAGCQSSGSVRSSTFHNSRWCVCVYVGWVVDGGGWWWMVDIRAVVMQA